MDVFLASTTRPLKAVLFTTKPDTPPLWYYCITYKWFTPALLMLYYCIKVFHDQARHTAALVTLNSRLDRALIEP